MKLSIRTLRAIFARLLAPFAGVGCVANIECARNWPVVGAGPWISKNNRVCIRAESRVGLLVGATRRLIGLFVMVVVG